MTCPQKEPGRIRTREPGFRILLPATNEQALEIVPNWALRECSADVPDDISELLGD